MESEMGVDAMRIRVQIRKIMAFSISWCRSVCNHPFLVSFVCFLILLYRSSPFIFSLLVSASPVLICTAMLLGILLSFGKPNIPEIEKEEKVTTNEVASFKTGVVEESTVVLGDVNGSISMVEKYVRKGRNVAENALDEAILVEDKVGAVQDDGGLVDSMPLIDENLREIQCENQVIEHVEREFNAVESQKKREDHEEKPWNEGKLNDLGGEVVDSMYSGELGNNFEVKDDKSPAELIDVFKEDQQGSAAGMYWKRLGEEYSDDNDDDGEESLDSGSDGAESSSPDASMADILPMLDELHPLLYSEAPQPVHISNSESDAGSLMSHKSDIESVESKESDYDGGECEDNDDDEVEDEEGGAGKEEIEDESKSAIKWTEVDQKNLMDLGTSELERNQRLENLIARRRAHKNLRLMTEKNLMNLESNNLPFNIPPLATTRQNPFELPYDLYDNIAIPGSAPSILLPRQNPFDLPHDSNEEKPDLRGDIFQQEFTAVQPRERVYRRNETFSIGASVYGGSKQERQAFRWRPYFVPERFSSEEGTSYSAFQSQLREVSESKISSVPATESLSSAIGEQDRQFHEQVPEQFTSEGMSYTIFQRQIIDISDSKVSSVPDTESVRSVVDGDAKMNKQDVSWEPKSISNMDHVTDHVEFGSQSSGDFDAVDIEQAANRDVYLNKVEISVGDVENHHEKECSVSGAEGMTTPEESNTNESLSGAEEMSTPKVGTNEVHLKTEPGEEDYSSGSSFSSLSEVNDKISEMREGELMRLEPRANHVEELGVSSGTLEELEFPLMKGVLEQTDPVFDSVPQRTEKFYSFASLSSDTQLEMTRMLGYANKSELHIEDSKKRTSDDFEEVDTASSEGHAADEDESTLREVAFTQTSECDNTVGYSGINPITDNQKGATVRLFSSDISPVEEYAVYREEQFLHEKDQAVSSRYDSENHQEVVQKLASAAPGDQISDPNSSLSTLEGQQPSMVFEHVIMHTSGFEPVEEKTNDKEETMQPKVDKVHLSSSLDKKSVEEGMTEKDRHFLQEPVQVYLLSIDEVGHIDGHQDVSEDLDIVPLGSQHTDFNSLTLSTPVEWQSTRLTEQVPTVHHPPETDRVQEHLLDNGETHQLEKDQVHSSSESKIDSDLHQEMDTMVISTKYSYEDVSSEEISTSELEKQLSWSDKSPSYDDVDETQEAPILQTGSTEEVNTVNNANVSEVPDHDQEVKILKNPSSMTYNASSTTFKSPGCRFPDGEKVSVLTIATVPKVRDHEDKTLKTSSSLTSNSGSTLFVKDEILDRVVYGNCDQVGEHLNNPCIDEENFNGKADELREIDERLLSELDTCGNFSVKEVGESGHIEPMSKETNILNAESLPNDFIPAATNSELPTLEAKSIKDIVLAFKQLEEGVDVEELILPSNLEDQAVVGEKVDSAGTNSDLPVLEARSLEDIRAVLKQVSQSNQVELSKPLDSKK